MLLVAVLAPLVVLATRVAADPNVTPNSPISLPFSKNFNVDDKYSPIQRDRRRWRNLVKDYRQSEITDVPLNDSIIAYSANISVGSPPNYYNLIIDTGSGSTWLGANKPYNKTKTSMKTSSFFNVTYGKGSALGIEYEDTVTIGPGVAIQQSIGVASNSSGIYPFDGILGLSPKEWTIGTLSPDNTSAIPTVTDNLFNQGKIQQNLVAVSFEPTTPAQVINGELTFGGTDPTKYTGEITYIPLIETPPANKFWAIEASFRYGNASLSNLNTTAGIVDTGTSLIGLATDAYNRYVGMTGAVFDNTTNYLRITPTQYENLQSLFFDIDGGQYELIANAQIWPRAYNNLIGGETDSIYLVVYDLGQELPQELGFIAGMALLERLYCVFDTTNSRVGFASTKFTSANTN